MKVRVAHILALCAVLSFLAGCSCGGPEIIPRAKMAEIYADMLIVDQWVMENPRTRPVADTSLVYEPVFESYGYTTEDYRASVEHYMKDPERYSRILRRTTEILDERVAVLQELKRIEDRRKAVKPYRINPFRLYYNRSVQRLWEFGDSVSVEVDSLVPVLEMHLHETADTTYDGLNMIIKIDSLAVRDSLALGDTIALKDSLAEIDAPAVKDSLAVTDTVTSVAKDTSSVKAAGLPRRLFGRALDSLIRK